MALFSADVSQLAYCLNVFDVSNAANLTVVALAAAAVARMWSCLGRCQPALAANLLSYCDSISTSWHDLLMQRYQRWMCGKDNPDAVPFGIPLSRLR